MHAPEIDTAEVPPVFEADTFTITHLSSSASGYDVVTRNTLTRKELGTTLPGVHRIAQEKQREKIVNKFTILRPAIGETPEQLRNRLLQREMNDGQPELRPEDAVVEVDHVRLIPGFNPYIGPRNIAEDDDKLYMDIMPVTHPVYRAINSLDDSPESLEIANPAATAAILFTSEADGSHRMILQHRSRHNYFYGDVPGASIGGFLDGRLASSEGHRGELEPIDTQYVKDNILKEGEEELGLSPKDINDVRLLGVAEDKVKYHTEFLLTAFSSLSADEVAKKVKARAVTHRPNDDFDFEGHFITLDAAPEVITKLLTEVKTPVPSTHAAAFIAAGYGLMIERDGLPAADIWDKSK
jgi:hypothetical protein